MIFVEEIFDDILVDVYTRVIEHVLRPEHDDCQNADEDRQSADDTTETPMSALAIWQFKCDMLPKDISVQEKHSNLIARTLLFAGH